jgi:hypothetical protein
VTGLTPGNNVTIYRVVSGGRTAVRGVDHITADATTLAAVDAELPFGVSVTYTVRVNGADQSTTTPVTYTLDGGKVALTDAISGQAAEVVIMAWPQRRRTRASSVFAQSDLDGIGYNVVVAGLAGQFTGQVELYTETQTAADSLTSLLDNCTSAVVQLRVPDASVYTGFDCYFSPLAWDEIRFSQDGNDPRRRWTIDIVEVPGWPSDLVAQGWTYDDLATAYTGGSYNTVAGDFATYIDLSIADIGSI